MKRNKLSKRDRRDQKVRKACQSRGYSYVKERVTVPYFGLGKVNECRGKFRQMLNVKRHAAKHPPTVYPDFIRFEVETDDDNDADLSYLGEFTDSWEPGAINYDGQSSNTYKWFIPAQTYADVRRDLIKMNVGKTQADQLAREYVAQDYKRAATHGDHWSMLYMTVTAYVGDTEIGSASLFGIESDSDDSFFTEVESDLKLEIMADLDLDSIKAQANALDQLLDYIDDEE